VGVAGLDRRFGVEAISKVPAAILAHVLVSRCSPSLMINAGTAGGFEARGAKIGDLFLGTKAVCHDRRIPLGGAFEAFGRGDFPVLHEERLLRELGARPGVVSTGDSLDCTPEDFRQLCALEADVKEMEAAAIAQVCESQGVPLVLLKSVTDFVDHHEATQDQFLRNYAQAVGQLSSGLWRLIRFYDSQCAL
jgi:5'-methylthioadenosine nucleosidase